MRVETWKISYYMVAGTGEVHLNEDWAIKRGYHQKLKRYFRKSHTKKSERDLVYKILDNYVELLLHGGRELPLSPQKNLERAVLLCDAQHPIVLTAPDKTEYRHTCS